MKNDVPTIRELLLCFLESGGPADGVSIGEAVRKVRPEAKTPALHAALVKCVLDAEISRTGERFSTRYRFLRRRPVCVGTGTRRGSSRVIFLEWLEETGGCRRHEVFSYFKEAHPRVCAETIRKAIRLCVAAGEAGQYGDGRDALYTLNTLKPRKRKGWVGPKEDDDTDFLPLNRKWLAAGEWGGVAKAPPGARSVFDLGGQA